MSSAASSAGDTAVTKDNYVPLFSGAPSDYREWRKRISLYMTKMKLLKRRSRRSPQPDLQPDGHGLEAGRIVPAGGCGEERCFQQAPQDVGQGFRV